MNWSQLRDSLMPLLLPLAILAASWTVQGIILTSPKKKKEIGKALIRGSKWFWGATIIVLILIEVFSQLAIYLK
jgi:hypothetical protein